MDVSMGNGSVKTMQHSYVESTQQTTNSKQQIEEEGMNEQWNSRTICDLTLPRLHLHIAFFRPIHSFIVALDLSDVPNLFHSLLFFCCKKLLHHFRSFIFCSLLIFCSFFIFHFFFLSQNQIYSNSQKWHLQIIRTTKTIEWLLRNHTPYTENDLPMLLQYSP